MTKDDKQFFKGLVQGLEDKLTQKITGLESGQTALVSRMSGLESGQTALVSRMSGLESGQTALVSRMSGLESGQMTLVATIQELDSRLTGEIRHNGVLIEKMQDNIGLLVESNQAFHQRIVRLEEAVL